MVMRKKVLKDLFITNLIFLGFYFVVYFFICFINWKVYNPFWWVNELGNKSEDFRWGVFGLWILSQIIKLYILNGITRMFNNWKA